MKIGLKRIVIGLVLLTVCGATALATRPHWNEWFDRAKSSSKEDGHSADGHAGHDHAGHEGHDHGGGDAKPVLTLSTGERSKSRESSLSNKAIANGASRPPFRG
jgi:ABC-type Zn2+ transport system substrate-binding protein/surface adhesin